MSEQNKAIAKRWLEEGISKGNLKIVDEIFSPDVIAHDPAGERHGVEEGPKQGVRMLRAAFPDLHSTIDDAIAEGDRAATRCTFHGTHQGNFMGAAPTGKTVAFRVTYFFRFANGKIAELWVTADLLGLLQQIGVARTP